MTKSIRDVSQEERFFREFTELLEEVRKLRKVMESVLSELDQTNDMLVGMSY